MMDLIKNKYNKKKSDFWLQNWPHVKINSDIPADFLQLDTIIFTIAIMAMAFIMMFPLSKHVKVKHHHVLNPPKTVESSSETVHGIKADIHEASAVGEAISAKTVTIQSTSLIKRQPLLQPTLRHCVESTKMLDPTSHRKQKLTISSYR